MSESDLVLNKLKKELGQHIGNLGATKQDVARIGTGVFQFDLATGGGFPKGRLSILYGAESSGKTTMAYLAIAYAQRVLKEKAVFVDVEYTFDAEWAETCGVLIDELIVMTPETAEQTVDVVEALLHASDVGIVVVDSIAAITTSNEIESEAGKMIVGGSSLMVGKLVRKSVIALATEGKRGHRPALLCINQVRTKIGVMYGDPEYFPGGNALRFASSMTIRLYGKDKMVNEVSQSMPTFKDTSATIRKWKVPIVSKAFEYELCLIPHSNIKVGQSKSWNTVSNLLKKHGMLTKDKTMWVCMGSSFRTLSEIEDLYIKDEQLRHGLMSEVYKKEMTQNPSPEFSDKTEEVLGDE